MGWPRKNDQIRIYADKQEKGAYFLVFSDQVDPRGCEAVANVHDGPEPSLCGTSIGHNYIAQTRAKRVEWDEIPPQWQAAFVRYLTAGDDTQPFDPHAVRGLWRIGNQPSGAKPR